MASDSKAAAGGSSKKLILYNYWRSSCSHRVRIALNLKGLEYEYKAVNILKGEQFNPGEEEILGTSPTALAIHIILEIPTQQAPCSFSNAESTQHKRASMEFEKLNPLKYVPVLVDEGLVIADSFAIILYLEEKYLQHPLLPHDLHKKAINIQVACIVSSSIQPLQNLPILNYIEEQFGPGKKLEWAQHHVGKGFAALEKLLEHYAGKYATGDEILLADVFLAPQIYAATVRFKMDMTPYPTLARLMDAYKEIPVFESARPEMQPDYPSGL